MGMPNVVALFPASAPPERRRYSLHNCIVWGCVWAVTVAWLALLVAIPLHLAGVL